MDTFQLGALDTFQLAVGVIFVLVECCFVLTALLAVIRGSAAALLFAGARFAVLEEKRCVRSLVGPNDISVGDGETDLQAKALMTQRNLSNAARLLCGIAVLSSLRAPMMLRDVLMTGGFSGMSNVGTAGSVALMVLSCLAVWAPRLVTTATPANLACSLHGRICLVASGPDLSFAIEVVLNLGGHLATALASLVGVGPLLVCRLATCAFPLACAPLFRDTVAKPLVWRFSRWSL